MEHSSDEDDTLQLPITIFGEPVIKTRCHRNAFITGISGGIVSGLIGFLVTSQLRRSMHLGFAGYITITFGMSCYCVVMEYKRHQQKRMIKTVVHSKHSMRENTKSSDSGAKVENENT